MQSKLGLLLHFTLACLHLVFVCCGLQDVGNDQRIQDRCHEETIGQNDAPDHVHALRHVLERVIGDAALVFDVQLITNCRGEHTQCFYVAVQNGIVLLQGTSGTELAAGAHWFLRQRCYSSLSWQLTGGNNINSTCFEQYTLAVLNLSKPIYRGRSVPYYYYQNVVTASYSSTWWDWPRWEQEIDWMAMHGINLALAFTGQEYIWQKVFARFNMSESDLEGFFAGPAYLAWQRMGNLQGFGGPLPQSYINDQAELQRKILARMRSLDMTPVLPAFAGFVPGALTRVFPYARISRLPNWGGFPPEFCCVSLLDPLDPLFVDIGKAFAQELRKEYGHDAVGFYSADTFNEMLPATSDPAYLKTVSSAVYEAMAAGDKSARWLMQAWTFFNDHDFWHLPQIQAYVSGVPMGRLIMIDLYAELFPVWKSTDSFSGIPYIWCMLHNFGGNTEMYGAFEAVAADPAEALSSSSIVGFGMCPEGIEQNPAAYALMSEWPFREQPVKLQTWTHGYVAQRYGATAPETAQAAWAILLATVYNATDRHLDHARDIPQSHPGISAEEVGLWGLRPQLWYDTGQVAIAWSLLLNACGSWTDPEVPDTLLYDLVDVGRQVLSKMATGLWTDIVVAYKERDKAALAIASRKLLDLLSDMDRLLATNRGFMLGPFLESAKVAAHTPQEEQLYEWNLRSQLTVWGVHPGGPSEIEDYANRQWAGLMLDYYRARWELWTNRLEQDLVHDLEYDATAWRKECLAFSLQWTRQQKCFPTNEEGDTIAVLQELWQKYAFQTEALPSA